MKIESLGRIDYEEALTLQTETLEAVSSGRGPETILLLEHPHVYTVGRRGRAATDAPPGGRSSGSIPTVCIARGGDITYHGPGQLVAYPILDLRRRKRDVHQYLRSLEESLIRTAADFGLDADRREGLTGIWTAQGKLASIGIGVRRWITMHGLALNVATDLRHFESIDPCGIPGCPVTSLSVLLQRPVGIDEVIPPLSHHLEDVLSRSGIPD